jgi:hypothetical protein
LLIVVCLGFWASNAPDYSRVSNLAGQLLADDAEGSLAVPTETCCALGLDEAEHWIRLDTLNRFAWPGYDLRPIPGTEEVAYGMLPRDLFEKLRAGILARQRARAVAPPLDRD